MYLKPAMQLMSRFQDRVHLHAEPEERNDVMKIDFISIITIITSLLPLIQNLCKKPAPPPTPTPAPVAALGVTDDTWKQACDSKWAANEAYNAGTGKYSATAIKNMARKIAKEDGIRPKAARPAAIAALDTARAETTEDIALTIHGTKVS